MPERIDKASRVIDSPPSKIYDAFATPGALETWLPPRGMTGRVLVHDFREGGLYRMRLSYLDPKHATAKTSADSDEVEVRFVRLAPNERIEQAVTFNTDKSEFAGEMRITWTLEALGSGTRVTVSCENVPEGISPEDHEAGLESTLDNLAMFVERRTRDRARAEEGE
jgi:uncharacterized protein YndB with AHSA1/START domain